MLLLILKFFLKMKSKILKNFAIALGILAISVWSLPTAFGQNDREDVAGLNNATIGCYAPIVLDCGLELGQQLICNFTGSYGAPFRCQERGCYGSILDRHCVQSVK